MKNLFILLFALLAFTACDDSGRDDVLPKKEGDGLVEVPVHIGLRPMVNAVTTRAENPLDPATENYMNSLRFFEFDQEGFHNRDEDYHEILLSQGHTSYPNITIQFHELSRTIVCVANVTPRNVEDLYNTYSGEGTEQEEGHITLADFKKWMIDVEYQQYDAETAYEKAFYSSVYEGLPVSMPMSAVFEGVPSDFQNRGITFYMGRLLTLLNFTLSFKSELNKPFGTEFYNVASQIHLFPGERMEVDRNWPPRFQIVDILPREGNAYWGPRESYKPGESVQRYLYIPATAATDWKTAVYADLFYGKACEQRFGNPLANPPVQAVPRDQYVIPNARVFLTANLLSTPGIDNPYQLDANTIYRIRLNLTLTDNPSELTGRDVPPIIFEDGSTTRAALPTRTLALGEPDAVTPDGTLVYDVGISSMDHRSN